MSVARKSLSAAKRLSPPDRLVGTPVVALDEAAARTQGEARRGPFRPEVWRNARQRHGSRLAVHYFRTFDVLAVAGCTLFSVWTVEPSAVLNVALSRVIPLILAAVVVLGLLRSIGLYRFARGHQLGIHIGTLATLVFAAGLAGLLTSWILTGAQMELEALIIWTGSTMFALYGLHLTWSARVRRWRRSGALTPNIVIVGATRHAERLIAQALASRDLNILGVFDDRLARSPESIAGVPVLGTADALLSHRMTPYVDRIVVAIDPKAQARVRELTARLETLPNEVTLLVDPHSEDERNAALRKLTAAPLASLDGPADPDRRAFNKRQQDLLVGLAALIVLAPVMALVAVAIRLESPGPIFFRQRRYGFNQEEIVVWKFRSMRHEAADATASRQVTTDDDRVTRVGRLIRGTSLDELPQILNVLRGEMSLVGPRPHAIGMKTGQIESARLVAEYAHRHRIKPGMTGWAAVNGSRGPLHTAADVRRRVQLDIDYIERQSLWMDLWIMAVTLPVLLGDRSAIR